MAPTGVLNVAKKKSESRRFSTLVRLDDAVAEKGRKVAALKGVSLGDYFSDILRPVVDRDLMKEARKLSKEGSDEQ